MKYSRALCALLAAMMTTISTAHGLVDVSFWAKSDVIAATSAGLMPETFAALTAKDAVSRAEFCAVALKLYEAERQTTVERTKKVYFDDCKDPDVNTAYEMRLISGRGNGTFSPNDLVSRQDLCVILDSVRQKCEVDRPSTTVSAQSFPDSSTLRDYAVDATETMLSSGIIRGVETTVSNDPEQEGGIVTLLQPDGTATREQALIMASRFLDVFHAEPLKPSDLPNTVDPVINDTEQSEDVEQDSPQGEDLEQIEDVEQSENEEEDAQTDEQPDDPSEQDQNLTMDEPIPVVGALEDKKIQVFGQDGKPYTDKATAEANMTDITVRVWSLLSSGQKIPSTKTIRIHQAIADQVQAVFDEIFEGSEQFPIKDVGGYAWRDSYKSEHRQGTAIDINYMENMECTIDEDGNILKITTGSHWLPWDDPYSIPAGGDVVRAFAAQGFAWGGDAWEGKRDYMHFSYFGT